MMNISQKKCVVDMLESEMEFKNIFQILDNLSAPMKDEVYVIELGIYEEQLMELIKQKS